MSSQDIIKNNIDIYTLKEPFESFMKKNNLTPEQVWERLTDELQVIAWVDVYDGMQEDLNYDLLKRKQ